MSTRGNNHQWREPDQGFVTIPTMFVPFAVWQTMMGFVQACSIEINGFGYIDRADNALYLQEVFILDQVATAASVEVSEATLARHLGAMTRAGARTGRLRFQWHSHVEMDAYFSEADMANIENNTNDWMVSLVANKHGDYMARLDVFKPFRAWTPLDVRVVAPVNAELLAHCRAEIHDKVRRPGIIASRRIKPETTLGPTVIPADAIRPRE